MDQMSANVSAVVVDDATSGVLVVELSDLQLLLVGGGIGDIIVA